VGNGFKISSLLIRLEARYEAVMGFFEYKGILFDNNQAERDLRMREDARKDKGKVSSRGRCEALS